MKPKQLAKKLWKGLIVFPRTIKIVPSRRRRRLTRRMAVLSLSPGWPKYRWELYSRSDTGTPIYRWELYSRSDPATPYRYYGLKLSRLLNLPAQTIWRTDGKTVQWNLSDDYSCRWNEVSPDCIVKTPADLLNTEIFVEIFP